MVEEKSIRMRQAEDTTREESPEENGATEAKIRLNSKKGVVMM